MPYYIDSKKANRKAWTLSIGIYIFIFIILLLAGASCSSPSRERAAVPSERFVVLTIVEVEDYRNTANKATVVRLERVIDHTVTVRVLRQPVYYHVGDTILSKWYKETSSL